MKTYKAIFMAARDESPAFRYAFFEYCDRIYKERGGNHPAYEAYIYGFLKELSEEILSDR